MGKVRSWLRHSLFAGRTARPGIPGAGGSYSVYRVSCGTRRSAPRRSRRPVGQPPRAARRRYARPTCRARAATPR